ncbi:MAG: LLM class flavin-dependent oxidoreductase [Chloroflexota bacterium]|nr:MAG: LLM class flavin-dependent oxidoreductase [Chloroflexota bacterium]
MARHKIGIGVLAGFMPPIDGIVKNASQNEDQGYHSLWWADHLMSWTPESIWTPDIGDIAKYVPNPHGYLDPISTMAAVAMGTGTIRLGTSVTEILRRHPAMLAQEFLSLDHISKGRAILGLGAGEGENTIPYGVDFTFTASKVEEALQVIRLLWSTDQPVDFEGRFFRLHKAVLGLRPYGQKPPPIWLAAMGPRMLDICARCADGWLPTFMPIEEYGRKLAQILELAKGYGRDTSDFHGSLWTYLVVDEDHEECHRILENPIIKNYAMIAPTEMFAKHGAEHPLGPDRVGLRDYIPTHFGREEALDAIRRIPAGVAQEFIMHGTPDELIAQLEDYADHGLQSIVMANISFMGKMSKLSSSYKHLLKVMEHFR